MQQNDFGFVVIGHVVLSNFDEHPSTIRKPAKGLVYCSFIKYQRNLNTGAEVHDHFDLVM